VRSGRKGGDVRMGGERHGSATCSYLLLPLTIDTDRQWANDRQASSN